MIIPMLCVTIFVILVVWFLLPRVARLMIHTPTAISIFVCLSMVQLMAVFISMRCTLCRHFLQVGLTLTLPGLVHCEDATSDVELFIATIRYLAQRQREFLPSSATQAEHLVVGSDDVRRDVAVAAAAPYGGVERLYDFLMQDRYASGG